MAPLPDSKIQGAILTGRLRLILDTNVLIPLSESTILGASLANLRQLCNQHGHHLLYHPASEQDVQRDRNLARRQATLSRLRQFTRLEGIQACPWNNATTSANDACDNEILYALYCNAAHALVTEDRDIHRKALRRGLANRVYYIQAAEDWLQRLHAVDPIQVPNIVDEPLHALSPHLQDPFFDSLRTAYNGFNQWFERSAMDGRRAWVYRAAALRPIDAICIYAHKTDDRITDDGLVLRGETLKLCTFKVAQNVRGRKVGELFLRAAFRYATARQLQSIYLHSNSSSHAHLTELIEDFGFEKVGEYSGDDVYVKPHPTAAPAVAPDSIQPVEYVRKFYPHYLSDVGIKKFIVPIIPRYHNILFPDCLVPGTALPHGHPQEHVGNAIKLAYLSHAPSGKPRAGDIVLFYRSHDRKSLTSLGVIEYYAGHSDAEEIARLVSRRTVYTYDEIEGMAAAETKVMLFRLIEHFENPIDLEALRQMRVVSSHPQSITEITDDSFSRILNSTRR